jgi:GNAT superfamily N-acetyltransferase
MTDKIKIRAMAESDRGTIYEMMRVFYASPAVLSNGSDEIFKNDIENCINDNPYLEGYVIEGEDGIRGYTMLAKSFSTEFGKPCIWIEDLYVKDEYRGQGHGRALLDFVCTRYTDCIFRLEAEAENEGAIRLYERCGFSVLPYLEMKK